MAVASSDPKLFRFKTDSKKLRTIVDAEGREVIVSCYHFLAILLPFHDMISIHHSTPNIISLIAHHHIVFSVILTDGQQIILQIQSATLVSITG